MNPSGLFYGPGPTTTVDAMQVVQSEYQALATTVQQLCPANGYRDRALRQLQASMMAGLFAIRLAQQKG